MTDTATAIHIARRATDSVVGVGDSRGWPRPKEYDRLIAVSTAAKAAVRDAEPPRYPVPAKPTDVDGWLTKTVQARLDATGRRAAAEELVVDVDRQLANLGPGIAAQYVPRSSRSSPRPSRRTGPWPTPPASSPATNPRSRRKRTCWC